MSERVRLDGPTLITVGRPWRNNRHIIHDRNHGPHPGDPPRRLRNHRADRRRRYGAGLSGHDTTLGRQVAIKILPDAFASDPERLARFEREAKTLASLNHPHIAAIYGFEKSAGMHALVMELVEGEDLSQRIARGRDPAR